MRRRAAWVLAVCGALVTVALVVDLRTRRLGSARDPSVRTAIVFTGDFARVTFALERMEAGDFDRVFISGVNAGAGMDPARFADQFRLSPALRAALARGAVVLAPRATDTLGNAAETACWLHRHPDVRAVALITSRDHMPRASVALERALRHDVAVVRVVSDAHDDAPGAATTGVEAAKFVATRALTLLPRAWWSPLACDPP